MKSFSRAIVAYEIYKKKCASSAQTLSFHHQPHFKGHSYLFISLDCAAFIINGVFIQSYIPPPRLTTSLDWRDPPGIPMSVSRFCNPQPLLLPVANPNSPIPPHILEDSRKDFTSRRRSRSNTGRAGCFRACQG